VNQSLNAPQSRAPSPVLKMKRHFRLFALYFAQYAKVRLAYKADFFIAFISSMVATVLGFGFVWVLFSKIPKLRTGRFTRSYFSTASH